MALIFFVYNFKIPNPNMILIAGLVISTSIGGAIPGGICAALMLIYSLFFFSIDHSFIHFTEENMHKVAVIMLGVLVNYISVALLKRASISSEQRLIQANADLSSAVKQLEHTNQELKKANAILKALATTDSLTGLRNRHALRQDFVMYIGIPLKIMFLDLDDFKEFNDTKGHTHGDEILAHVGKTLTDCFRTSNCYRYGGDEFLIIAEHGEEAAFTAQCSEARRRLQASDISFSGGYVSGIPESIKELRSMIIQADIMLYESKISGKDQFKGRDFDRKLKPDRESIRRYKSRTRIQET